MGYIKTISISEEFKKLAEEHHISWTEAARVGVSLILAERGVKEYDNKLNIVRKKNALIQHLNDVSSEKAKTEEHLRNLSLRNKDEGGKK
tara:strand:+ start:924 stop:1193 length:270 start_codon:yes stop_codon:yes gene_type:complete